MPAKTNFNVSPYFDDFQQGDDFYRVLFRPGFAVQARELTTLQTTLQNQIEQFGNHMFKEGTIVIPGSVGYDSKYYALKLQSTFGSGTVATYLEQYKDAIITGATSGVTAKVIGYSVADSTTGDPDTLFVKYINASSTDNSTTTFADGESISANKAISSYGSGVVSASTASTSPNATGAAVTVLAGVYFIRGFMVQNTEQTVILDKYTNTPSYRVGWEVTETLVTPETDASLLDNAQGSSNYAAKGAHRLKITLTLIKKAITATDDSNFVELVRVNNGIVENKVRFTEYSVIADMIARRTDDESGNYIVKHFDIEVRENLDDGTNRGVYTASKGGVETKNTLVISPGKAYVGGYETEIQRSTYVNIDKARATKNIQNDTVPASLGNYVKVDNVYGQPDISLVGSTIDPFKLVKLYDQQTASRGSSAGSNIGYARSRAFEYYSGTQGNVAAIHHHYLFDITLFQTVDVSAANTLTAKAIITGTSSGATGVVVASITSAAQFQLMQVQGSFLTGESFTSSVTTDTVAGTISAVTTKNFGRDVKQVFMDTSTGLDYTADINLTESKTLGGTIDVTTTAVTGFGTEFLSDLVVGDIVSLPTGAAGAQEERRVTNIASNLALTISSAGTNNVTKVPIKRLRGAIQEIEETVLVYKMPKDNIKTLLNSFGATDTSYVFRKQFTTTATGSGVATFTLPAGQTWAAPSVGRNYTMTVTGSAGGSAAVGDVVPITGTAVGSGTNTLTVTDGTVMGNNTQVELMGSINIATSSQRSKTAQKMTQKQIQSHVGGGTRQNVYGERLGDATISLSYADVYKLHGVYESTSNSTDAVPPSLTTTGATGTFTTGEIITGSVSSATGRVISDAASTLKYVVLSGTFTTLDTITGGTSGFTASVSATVAGDRNVTSSFDLDTGQRDSFYDLGRIVRKPGVPAPTGRLLIIYDYFTHGTGDYFSVDSYTGQVDYKDIPFYSASRVDLDSRAPIGEYPLADSLDFRPRVNDQATPSTSPFAYENKDFESTGAVAGNLVSPDDNITADFDFYLARNDLLYLDQEGNFTITQGVSAEDPVFPATDNINMLVGKIFVPPYTFSPEDVQLEYLNNKGYTMQDISKLETRIAKLEYSTALGLLERETDSFMILDGDGMNRFKSGFVVDNFYGHNVGNSSHKDYHVSIDPGKGHLRPVGVQGGVDLIEEATTDSARSALSYKKTGDIITLPYTEFDEMVQPYASRVENVNPYMVTQWIGDLVLEPETDVWMDDDRIPSITINVEGNYEQMLREQTEAGALGTVWNSWNDTWTGNARSSSSTSVQVRSDNAGLRAARAAGRRDIGGLRRTVTTTTTSVDVRQRRTGTNTRLVERIDNISAGDRVTNIEVVPWMRSRDINFTVTGLKPNTRMYAFFDGVDVNIDVKPIGASASDATISSPFAKADTTLTVNSTSGFPDTGTIGVGDTSEVDPFGVGFIKQEQMTYTGKTSTTFTGITRNTGNQYDEAQNWLSTTPVNDQTYGNPLITDSIGTLYGRFKLPNTDTKRFRIGRRTFRLTDSSTNSLIAGFASTSAEKEYMAIGHKQTKQELILATRNGEVGRREVAETRQITRSSGGGGTGTWFDPLAQSIMVDREGGIFVTSVDLFFSHKDTTLPVWVEMRTMKNGYPTTEVLPMSRKYLNPADVNVNTTDGTTATTFNFPGPVYLNNLTEYCVVVASDSAEYKVWISRLGEIDVGGNRAISSQPTLGSLFKSQNASTWTASQYEDLKFTLRRAKFDTSVNGSVAILNDTFTEAETATGGGNGLIPILPSNPLESVTGQSKVKVKFVNHMNHATNNNVEIKGAISDIGNTALNGSITDAATTITCDDVTNFPTAGTVKIDRELITYTGKSGTTGLTGCTRGTVNGDGTSTTAAAHDDNSIVELYMFGGIPLIEINKVHTGIENPELDSFIINTSTSATTTTGGGGSKVYVTKNISYDVLQPLIQTMELPNTTLTAKLQTTSGTTVGSTQTSFTRLDTTNAIDIPLNEDYYFDAPQMICSPINETNELSSNKSLRIEMTLSSTLDNVSPVIDTQRMFAVAVSSRLNEIDSSSDVNTTFTKYHPMTESEGDNNSAIYITKKVTLANSATALKVLFDAVQMTGADIRVLYKIQRLDAAEPFEDLGWTYFTGSSGSADGLSETAVPTSKNREDFKEYSYLAGKKTNGTGDALDEFNAFAIKIVMQGNNSSTPPIIKDFRSISLAT